MLKMRKRSSLACGQGADGLLGQVSCQAEKAKNQSQWLQEFGEPQIHPRRKYLQGALLQPSPLPDLREFLKEQNQQRSCPQGGRETLVKYFAKRNVMTRYEKNKTKQNNQQVGVTSTCHFWMNRTQGEIRACVTGQQVVYV